LYYDQEKTQLAKEFATHHILKVLCEDILSLNNLLKEATNQ